MAPLLLGSRKNCWLFSSTQHYIALKLYIAILCIELIPNPRANSNYTNLSFQKNI